jgi:hypothetical protein
VSCMLDMVGIGPSKRGLINSVACFV